MLREINAARANNRASHQLSQSQLTGSTMPPRRFLMSEIQSNQQGETDQRTAGINTSQRVLDNFIDYRA